MNSKEFELINEEAERLINEMMYNITELDASITSEVLFTANCLEILADREFSPYERTRVCYELTRIVKAKLTRMFK